MREKEFVHMRGGRSYSCSCGHLLIRQEQLERRQDNNQQQQRHQPPRFFAERNQAFQFAQKTSPGRQWLGNAQAKDAQIRLAQDKNWNRNPELRIQDRLQVGQDMNEEEPRTVQARSPSLQHKIGVAQGIGAGREHACRSSPAEQTEDEKRNQNRDQRRDVQREERTNRDQQEKPGQRKKQVSEAPGQTQPDSAQVSCEPADQRG